MANKETNKKEKSLNNTNEKKTAVNTETDNLKIVEEVEAASDIPEITANTDEEIAEGILKERVKYLKEINDNLRKILNETPARQLNEDKFSAIKDLILKDQQSEKETIEKEKEELRKRKEYVLDITGKLEQEVNAILEHSKISSSEIASIMQNVYSMKGAFEGITEFEAKITELDRATTDLINAKKEVEAISMSKGSFTKGFFTGTTVTIVVAGICYAVKTLLFDAD